VIGKHIEAIFLTALKKNRKKKERMPNITTRSREVIGRRINAKYFPGALRVSSQF